MFDVSISLNQVLVLYIKNIALNNDNNEAALYNN